MLFVSRNPIVVSQIISATSSMHSAKTDRFVSNSLRHTMDCFKVVSDLIKTKTAAIAEVDMWYTNGDIDDADKIRLVEGITATYEASKKSALFPSPVSPLDPGSKRDVSGIPDASNASEGSGTSAAAASRPTMVNVPPTVVTKNSSSPARSAVVDLTTPHLVSPPVSTSFLGKRSPSARDTDGQNDSAQSPVGLKTDCPLLRKIEYGLRNEYGWTIKDGKGEHSGRTVYIPPGNFYTLEGRPVLNRDYFINAEEAMQYAHLQQGQLKPKGVVWMTS